MLVEMLEAGRRDFLSAVDGVDGSLWRGGWSVTEIVEHVAIVEDRYSEWIRSGTEPALPRDSAREMRLFTAVRSRFQKVEAVEAVWPRGRFGTLAEAVAEFAAVRDRTVAVAAQEDKLYGRGAVHPYFGRVNGVELIQLIDAHARRHADQIRELVDREDG